MDLDGTKEENNNLKEIAVTDTRIGAASFNGNFTGIKISNSNKVENTQENIPDLCINDGNNSVVTNLPQSANVSNTQSISQNSILIECTDNNEINTPTNNQLDNTIDNTKIKEEISQTAIIDKDTQIKRKRGRPKGTFKNVLKINCLPKSHTISKIDKVICREVKYDNNSIDFADADESSSELESKKRIKFNEDNTVKNNYRLCPTVKEMTNNYNVFIQSKDEDIQEVKTTLTRKREDKRKISDNKKRLAQKNQASYEKRQDKQQNNHLNDEDGDYKENKFIDIGRKNDESMDLNGVIKNKTLFKNGDGGTDQTAMNRKGICRVSRRKAANYSSIQLDGIGKYSEPDTLSSVNAFVEKPKMIRPCNSNKDLNVDESGDAQQNNIGSSTARDSNFDKQRKSDGRQNIIPSEENSSESSIKCLTSVIDKGICQGNINDYITVIFLRPRALKGKMKGTSRFVHKKTDNSTGTEDIQFLVDPLENYNIEDDDFHNNRNCFRGENKYSKNVDGYQVNVNRDLRKSRCVDFDEDKENYNPTSKKLSRASQNINTKNNKNLRCNLEERKPFTKEGKGDKDLFVVTVKQLQDYITHRRNIQYDTENNEESFYVLKNEMEEFIKMLNYRDNIENFQNNQTGNTYSENNVKNSKIKEGKIVAIKNPARLCTLQGFVDSFYTKTKKYLNPICKVDDTNKVAIPEEIIFDLRDSKTINNDNANDVGQKDVKVEATYGINRCIRKSHYLIAKLHCLKKSYLNDKDLKYLQECNLNFRKINGKYILKKQYGHEINSKEELDDIWDNKLSEEIKNKFTKLAKTHNRTLYNDLLRNQWMMENKEKF